MPLTSCLSEEGRGFSCHVTIDDTVSRMFGQHESVVSSVVPIIVIPSCHADNRETVGRVNGTEDCGRYGMVRFQLATCIPCRVHMHVTMKHTVARLASGMNADSAVVVSLYDDHCFPLVRCCQRQV